MRNFAKIFYGKLRIDKVRKKWYISVPTPRSNKHLPLILQLLDAIANNFVVRMIK